MKTLLLTAIAVAAIAALAAIPGALRTSVTLEWDYPPDKLTTNLTFKVYASTNLSEPLTNWPLLTNIVGTNLTVTLPVDATKMFFVMTASNWWGESDFSEVASTPDLPRSDVKIRLGP